MSKVTPSSQFDQFSGKLSAFDRNVLRTRNGRIHSYVIHNPYKGPLAESRKSAINTFAQAVRQCKEEMMDEAKLAQWKKQYVQYTKTAAKTAARANAKVYSTLRGFIIATLSARLRAAE